MAEIKTNENASEALDQDQTDGISSIISSGVTWRNPSGPSPIHRPQLNHNDSYSCVSSESLIKD